MGFPSMSFASELSDPTLKELRALYAQLEDFLRSAGFNEDGSFSNVVVNNITIQPNPELPPVIGEGGAPVYGGITVINPPGSPNDGAHPFGGGSNCCDDIGIGSLAFTGFGDDPMKFYSPSGLPLLDPASAPVEPGAGCDGIVALTTNRIATIGGGNPNFPATGIGVWNTDFTVHAQGGSGAHGFGGRSIARDGIGNFYVAKSVPTGYLFRYSESGSQTGAWQIGNTPICVAVNAAGTIAYFVEFAALDTVKAWDLSGNTSLGTFVTNAGFSVFHNGMVCVGSDVLVGWKKAATTGYVTHYSAAGTTLFTYALLGSVIATTVLTPGLTDFTVWVGYYDGTVNTSSGVRIVELQLGTGALLHQFAPEDGAFEFDGPFCVLRARISAA